MVFGVGKAAMGHSFRLTSEEVGFDILQMSAF